VRTPAAFAVWGTTPLGLLGESDCVDGRKALWIASTPAAYQLAVIKQSLCVAMPVGRHALKGLASAELQPILGDVLPDPSA